MERRGIRGDALQLRADVDSDRRSGARPPFLDGVAESLMAGYQTGDLTAATALIHLMSPALHRYFLADAASRAHADDLLQETWLRIHRVRHTYLRGEPVYPWFYAIARRVRIDHYRKVMRTTAREEELTETLQTAVGGSSSQLSAEELDHLLGSLPGSQREAIVMLKVLGMTLEEVARATSSTVGSVKQKVHRAYKKLREKLFAVREQNSQNGDLR
jgi:RNA polymerase sigma-70 factor (ECF subfamily)